MNKIFKVKQNAFGQSVVCSELTRSRGKVKSLVLSIAAASSVITSTEIMAATSAAGTSGTVITTGDTAGNLAMTSAGTATATGENSIAIGNDTNAIAANTIVIGENSSAVSTGDIVIGNNNDIISLQSYNGYGNNIILGNNNTNGMTDVGFSSLGSSDTVIIGSNNSMGIKDDSYVGRSAIIGTNSHIGTSVDADSVYNMYIFGSNSSIAVQGCGTTSASGLNIQIIGSNSSVIGEADVDLGSKFHDFKTNVVGYYNTVNVGAITLFDEYTYSDFNILGNNNNISDSSSHINMIGSGHTGGGLKTSLIGFNNTSDGKYSSVMGNNNTITSIENTSIVGNGNKITGVENVLTVGNNITTTTNMSVILGTDSASYESGTATAGRADYPSYTIKDTTYNFAGTTPHNIISVGATGKEGRIQNVASGLISAASTDAINGSQLYAVVSAVNAIKTTIDTVSDTNTQATVTAGQGTTINESDNSNGTKNYTVNVKVGEGLTYDDKGNVVNDMKLTAGENVQVSGDAKGGYTIKATNTQSVVKAGNGVTVDVADNDIGTKDYTVSTKIGDGLTFGSNGEIKATGTIINAGDNVTVTGDALNGYTISTKGGITDEQLQDVINQINGIVDTNTQSTTSAGQGIVVTETNNANGTKNYAVLIKATDGLTFDDNGNIKVSDTLVKAGDNVQVSGNAKDGFTVSAKGTEITAGDNVNVSSDTKNGYTISVENMRTTVTGGQGAEVTSSDNADGSKNYTVNVKVGEGLTYDDKGNLVNDMKLTAGENVQVSGDAKGGYTISATDTNTQATVSADKGITITETNNANGTKNYAVSAKLGKGLKVDENGAIAATAQPINGGAGVTITTNAQDEAIVNVTGVTTTTDDGKSYTRSDLTKPVGVKGDGKNIRTSTTVNGDVQVKLADDIQVNSVTIHNGPTINQQGINAANTRITNVQDGVAPTDAVNVRQLNQQGNIINQRIDNLADNVKKNKKRNDAGIASTAAMANIPQVMLAGKSGVGVGVGHRSGQSAIAVGYSRASDNAKHIIKLSVGMDTQSKATLGAGYMYQW